MIRTGLMGVLAAVLGFAGAAAGQSGVALVPSGYKAVPGERLNLSLRDFGNADAGLAWDDTQIAWSVIRVAGTQENSDRAPRAEENAPAGSIRINTAGAAVVGVDFKPRVMTLDAAAVRKLTEGRTDIKAVGELEVRAVQSAKTVIRVGAMEPEQSGNVTSKTGQQVELRPVFDPTGMGIGSDIPIVVYAGDGKVPGARLTAMHVASGEKEEFVANGSAIGHFRLSKPGAWRVEVRHLGAVKPGPNVKAEEPKWVLYSATLTFEAREQAAAKPAVKEGAK